MLTLKKALLAVVLAATLLQVQGVPTPDGAECGVAEGAEDVAIGKLPLALEVRVLTTALQILPGVARESHVALARLPAE